MRNRLLLALLMLILVCGAITPIVSAFPPGLAQSVRSAQPAPDEEPESEARESDRSDDTGDEGDDAEEDEDSDAFLAIQGGTVYTVTGAVVDGATVLCKNGRILSIGRGIKIPENAEILDATGLRVYPGLVAARSLSIVGGEPVGDTTDVYGMTRVLALAAGITTAVSGDTAAKVTYKTLEDMVLRENMFVSLRYDSSSPSSKRETRRTFERLRKHLRDTERYEREKRENPDAEELKTEKPDDKWIRGRAAEYLKLIKKESTALATANTAYEMLQLCELAETFGFSLVIRGAAEGWTIAPALARSGVSLIITPREDRPSDDRLNRPTGSSIENAAVLHQTGVRFAIIPARQGISLSGLAGRDMQHLNMEAAFAVRGGLSEENAIRAITIDAARILGVDHRVGSIEVGKDADFAIMDGNILDYMTHVRYAVVNGRIAYDKQAESLFDHIRPDGDKNAPPPNDYWPRRLGDEMQDPKTQ